MRGWCWRSRLHPRNARKAVWDVDSSRLNRGSNATEYTLILALIAAVIVAGILVFGRFLSEGFNETCDEVGASVNAVNQAINCE